LLTVRRHRTACIGGALDKLGIERRKGISEYRRWLFGDGNLNPAFDSWRNQSWARRKRMQLTIRTSHASKTAQLGVTCASLRYCAATTIAVRCA